MADIRSCLDIAKVVNIDSVLQGCNARESSSILSRLTESLDGGYKISEAEILAEVEGTVDINASKTGPNDKKKKKKIDKKIPLKTLLKVQEEIDNKFNLIETTAIDGSVGDIKKLTNSTYAKVLLPVKENVGAIIDASSTSKSKYLVIYNNLLKTMIKFKNSFTKSYRKKNSSITKMTYKAGILYLVEMGAILSNTLVYMYNRERKDFDRLLSKTRSFKDVFTHAEKFNELINERLFKSEMKIIESADADVDQILLVDFFLEDCIKEDGMSISTASKLINYGFSSTIYKTFAVFRYIIYLSYYRKYTMQNKVDMISKNIDTLDASTSTENVKTQLTESHKDAQEFRVDSIEASNKTDVEVSKGENIDLNF